MIKSIATFTLWCYNQFVSRKSADIEGGDNMRKLEELIYNQMELVKYMNESKTRTERMFYKNEINVMETLIEKTRQELSLY